MKILLTNDDGYNSEGITSLYNILSQKHEAYIIAPDRERSACSNIFTVRDRVEVNRIDENIFSISGYPADCVSIGLHSDIIPDVDIVISGINHGPNLGDDIHFSGTVAGARTAYIFGKPGIAFSIDSFHRPSSYFYEASEFLLDYIDTKLTEKKIFYNINYPELSKDTIKGIKYTFLSRRYYKDSYKKDDTGDTNIFGVSLVGQIDSEMKPGCDSAETANGFISITPLSIDSTDYKSLEELKNKA
jgi:5'-nucleotidase